MQGIAHLKPKAWQQTASFDSGGVVVLADSSGVGETDTVMSDGVKECAVRLASSTVLQQRDQLENWEHWHNLGR
ncbi:hypothetical protein V6N12_074877 [Hibiscus sabdariffa]|uniref:Uncharacterized protein n=1 Tax=Hibiscus sabdariffa TaxID=183260 RepID=A0ABR2D2P6_9ROSI